MKEGKGKGNLKRKGFKRCQTECVNKKGRLVNSIISIFTPTIFATLLLSTLLVPHYSNYLGFLFPRVCLFK